MIDLDAYEAWKRARLEARRSAVTADQAAPKRRARARIAVAAAGLLVLVGVGSNLHIVRQHVLPRVHTYNPPIYAVNGVLDDNGWAQVDHAQQLKCRHAERFRVTLISQASDGAQQALTEEFDC